MSEWLSAEHIQDAAAAGRTEIAISRCAKVTPLAAERAADLGVTIVVTPGAVGAPKTPALSVDELQRKVREVARKALLDAGEDLGKLDEVLAAVLGKLRSDHVPGCGCAGSKR